MEVDNKKCILTLDDGSGLGLYGALFEHLVREANGIILVYSIHDRTTFESICGLRKSEKRIEGLQMLGSISLRIACM